MTAVSDETQISSSQLQTCLRFRLGNPYDSIRRHVGSRDSVETGRPLPVRRFIVVSLPSIFNPITYATDALPK